MGISFGSINTGLPPNIVEKIIEAERIPVKNLEIKKAKVEEQKKLVDDLSGKISEIFKGLKELGGSRGFEALKLETTDPSVVAGSVDRAIAQEGSWQVEVIKLAHKTSAISNGFPDKDKTEVGVGYIRFYDAQGNKKDVYVDGSNNTLEGIVKVINSKGVGIRASVFKDSADKETPYKLMLQGTGIGEEGNVEFPQFYFLDGDQDFYVDFSREAENGKVKIDGVEFDINDNKVRDAIPGVVLDIRSPSNGKEVTVSIGQDSKVIVGKIKSFVDQVNGVLGFIQTQNKLTKESDTTRTLGGDSVLRQVESRLRDALLSPIYGVVGPIKNLSQVGITFNRGGLVDFDEEKFNNTVVRNLPEVQAFMVGDGMNIGLIPRMKQVLNGFLDNVSGPVTNRVKGFQGKIDSLNHQIESKERNLQRREQQLRSQFAKLEETMSRLKSQGQYFAAQTGSGGMAGLNLSASSSTG